MNFDITSVSMLKKSPVFEIKFVIRRKTGCFSDLSRPLFGLCSRDLYSLDALADTSQKRLLLLFCKLERTDIFQNNTIAVQAKRGFYYYFANWKEQTFFKTTQFSYISYCLSVHWFPITDFHFHVPYWLHYSHGFSFKMDFWP